MVIRKLGFNSGVTLNIKGLISFHDHAMLVAVLVIGLIVVIILGLCLRKFTRRNIYEEQRLEVIWTIIPAVLLVRLAIPSLRLLYLRDEVLRPELTVKCLGHQWYWSYEYRDNEGVEFDSYIVAGDELKRGRIRVLDVDNRVVLPVNREVRLVIRSSDVIHSWAVPRFGVKVDAIPGRLNEVGVVIDYVGVYYGQCSEICGANHSFMPIVVEVVDTWDL